MLLYKLCQYFVVKLSTVSCLERHMLVLKVQQELGNLGASLVVHWLAVCLPVQATQVPSRARKDSTSHEATKPMCCNYWPCSPEPVSCNNWARLLQLSKPSRPWAYALQQDVVVVQSLSHVRLFATPWSAAGKTSLSFTISRSLFKLTSFEMAMPSNHLALCHPLLLLPSILPSIRVFSNELALHIRWPEFWCFSISPSSEYSGLISFRIDFRIYLKSKGLSRVFSNTTV